MADSGETPQPAEQDGRTRARVRRRRLYYLAGFDPASPKKYHAIFTAEAPRQAALTGVTIEAGPLEDRDELEAGWQVTARYGGEEVSTNWSFLRWYDIVRAAWPKDEPRLFVDFWRALKVYFDRRIMAISRRDAPVVALASASPTIISIGFLMTYALLIGGLCWAGVLVARALGWPGWTLGLAPLLVVLALFPAWRFFDRFLNVAWLGRGMVCMVRAGEGRYPLDERAAAYAEKLVAADKADDVDEILVVGHSMGGQLAAQALGKAVRADPQFGLRRAQVNLLTLGQLIPFYSLITEDERFHADVAALAQARQIGWMDVTSPADGGCAAWIHPLEGVRGVHPQGRPARRSPRFHLILTKQSYRSLLRRPLDYHFHYIKAAEILGDYDFFRLTTGPEPLTAAYPQGPAESAAAG